MVSHFDVSLGAYSEVDNTYVHHIHTFLHTGSGLYHGLYKPSTAHTLCPTASYPLQHFYNTLQHSTTTLCSLQLYSTSSTVYNLYNNPSVPDEGISNAQVPVVDRN